MVVRVPLDFVAAIRPQGERRWFFLARGDECRVLGELRDWLMFHPAGARGRYVIAQVAADVPDCVLEAALMAADFPGGPSVH